VGNAHAPRLEALDQIGSHSAWNQADNLRISARAASRHCASAAPSGHVPGGRPVTDGAGLHLGRQISDLPADAIVFTVQ